MELRELADRILFSASLAEKLSPLPDNLTDRDPGPAESIARPARPDNLQFAARRTAPAMPPPGAFHDPARRAVAHHIMANHELQALEVMAWVLRAFPAAPTEFRKGLVAIMRDEQRHTRMHVERARVLGVEFGQFPVNSYIWQKAQDYRSVLDYLAGLPLTFEGRNLDHTVEFEQAFLAAGDRRSAVIMATIHREEIEHVAFGLRWLRELKPPEASDWETYSQHLHWPMRPSKSVGDSFQRDARLAAGMSSEFVDLLQAAIESDDRA